jgi:arginyl-tRNA synthetase
MYNFEDVLIQVTDKNEPSVLSRYLINVAKTYSGFYNNNKVIVEDEKVKKVRIFLTYMVNKILEIGGNLLGIQMPEKM